uniref:Uncharacterized protein n=1 Tax=Arundo donax TaxID=35708 RepID=A0A0A8ZCX2_ARUDO
MNHAPQQARSYPASWALRRLHAIAF